MDKNAIKKFAVWARQELISRVSQRAAWYGITEKDPIDKKLQAIHGHVLTPEEQAQRRALIWHIRKNGYQQVMEEVAYTWFNRFIALRFMEVNGYLPSYTRVFSDENGTFNPQILKDAIHLDIEGLDMEKIYAMEEANEMEALFKYLVITQCNDLSRILPGMFQKISDYTELLFPDFLLREGSVAHQMVTTIPEEDWKDAVQIIGWLYQYYNAEPKDAIQQMLTLKTTFSDLSENLMTAITSLADEFAEIKREIKDDTLNADTFVQLTAEMTKTQELLNQLEEKAKMRSSIETAYRKAARQRNDNLQQQFYAYQAEINRINNTQKELRIEITFKGDREEFKTRLKSDFRGSGISEIKYQTICETFTDYVDLIEDWVLANGSLLRGILTPGEYIKLDAKLKEQYVDLLEYQVQNKVEIYYHNKLLRQHSIGQRASALILFILTQDNNDVIFIDQPEDDLDNKVIYDEVITAITKKKANMQFVFATHNANIPVLGDAERILVVDYQDTRIDISQGNIDLRDTHKQIVDIMEGGKDAFEKRQLIYESWR